MNYSVNIDGVSYELPAYSFGMAEQLDGIKSKTDLREKCEAIYNFAKEKILKEKTEDVLGKFEDVDPNAVIILYEDICSAYREPLEKSALKMVNERLASGEMDKIAALMDKMDKIK